MTLAVLTAFATLDVSAASHDLNKKYKDIKEQIREGKNKLKQARHAESITLNELERTSRLLNEVSQELKTYQTRLAKTRMEAASIKADIESLEKKIDSRKIWIRRKLQAMQRYGKHGDTLLMLGASENLPQLLRRWHYLEVLAGIETAVIEEFKEDISKLERKKGELTKVASRLKKEEKQVAESQEKLQQQKKDRESMLAMVRQKQQSYERMIRDLRKSAARMQKLIDQSGASGTYHGKGFRGLKGRLPWPVTGQIAIPYGSQKDPEFNTPVFRNGVYIGTSSDSVARAVHAGRVVYADWFKGYGQLVIINHGEGYHSLYGNLSEIFLKAGDIIKKDASIGRVGSSGMLDRPSLYFEVRYKGRPLNPSHWLAQK